MEPTIANVEILIVDGSEEFLGVFRAGLDADAANVRVVRGLAEAQAAAAAAPVDLLFVGAQEAPARGLEIVRALRNTASGAAPVSILIGGLGSPAENAAARTDGVSDFLSPPFAVEQLAARVWVHLDAARDRRELARERAARLHAEEESRVAQRAKSELLASMGHEIRTPMTAILGMSHLALQSGLNPKQRNYVEKVERSAESLLGTLNDILDYARIEAGTLELQRSRFELADVLAGLARLVGLSAEEKGLELLFEIPRDLPPSLIGDGTRLTQVLVDLGHDAVHHGDHGEVVIGIELVERDVHRAVLRFSVRDTGAARSIEQAAQGADLGLAIGHHLVRSMGGELTATPPPAAGHLVHFTIAFDLPPDTATATTPMVGGTRLLVVDDNATARRIMTAMAIELGLQVESARDAWDAMRMVSQAQRLGRPYDIALIDWKMPGMDGVECARQLLNGQAPPAILLVTAFGEHDVAQRLNAQRVMVRGVIAKPVTPAVLRDAFAAALRPGPPAPANASGPEQVLRAYGAQLRGARILLVEDNAIIQELALDLLTGAGMIVSVAENGREALARLAKQGFDGVLMDCQMPVMDGYEATRALRALPHLRDLPVIALTANALEGERTRVMAAGMNDHIAKPLDVVLMFETLARWVRPAIAPPAVAAPVVSTVPDDPLLRLPGIDARIGRSSTMNNDKLYRRLLGMFLDGQGDFAAQFRAARTAGDEATALRLAHNLRAVSASLGAVAVQHSSSALERACTEKLDDAGLAPLLARVEADLDPVLAGLASLPR